MDPKSLFSLSDHLDALSKEGDPLEVLQQTVDFEYFRAWLVEGLGYGDGAKGGRPPFDPVMMFKALILQAQLNLSDARMEFMIRDRLSWLRFLALAWRPDAGREHDPAFSQPPHRDRHAQAGHESLRLATAEEGYIPMSGQIVDASLVPAPKQRNTEGERDAIKSGMSAKEIWPDEPNKAAQKDTDARWTLKIGGKVRYRADGTPLPMIALPVFGYKSHISIDRRFGFIRDMAVTSASAADGRLLRQVVSRDNTGSEVWADSAYRSKRNEKWLSDRMLTSRIHRRKPKGRPMPKAIARANAVKSSIRAHVEHVFAHQENRFGIFICTIGLARAEAKLTLYNLAYNFNRLISHGRRDCRESMG